MVGAGGFVIRRFALFLLGGVPIALWAANPTGIVRDFTRLGVLRESPKAGAKSSGRTIITIASRVGFGAVVAPMPTFALIRDAALRIRGGPWVSPVVAMNALAALTGTASGGHG
ncbi:hypothetical protein [Pandoraea oxalativorans]|uniref:Uncharacterized protein n=1 Tax=Pandoraea oxalativorans TaxID=573737 RepID=A0A192B0Y1_9BURK|nr:hypothetical protein [Pandoraea oxalativorans]ANJ86778.1 hypothetical protein MB84_31465 [Pandoraea oxalativorans]